MMEIEDSNNVMAWASMLKHIRIENVSGKSAETDPGKDVIQGADHIFVKGVPQKYERQFRAACGTFGELQNEDIRLVFRKIKMTMQARPVIGSLLLRKRKYVLVMNTRQSECGIHFDTIPFEAQVGILAHELAHILDYKYRSRREFAALLFTYSNLESRAEYEKSIDLLTILKGYGKQLKAWAQFSMFDSEVCQEYKEFKRRYYLSPSEIEFAISFIKANGQEALLQQH